MLIDCHSKCALSVAAKLLQRNYMRKHMDGSVHIVPVSIIKSEFSNQPWGKECVDGIYSGVVLETFEQVLVGLHSV